MFRNIVVGLKEGLPPDSLLELTKAAAGEGAAIHLVTMVRVGTNQDERERLSSAERHLAHYAETLRASDFDVSCEAGFVTIAAAADLLRIASTRGADLIVIGLAKRSRVGKALMGSDAQRVLLGAECPTLVTQTYS